DSVVFKLTNAMCRSYNKSWVVINTCRLKAVGRNKIMFNLNATLLHPTSSIVTHYKIYKRANGFHPWFVNMKVDGCRFMTKPYDPIAILLFNLYKQFSNINHTCPFVGNVYLKNMYLTPDMMRLPLPTGDYLLAIDWNFYGVTQVSTNLSFQFIEDLMK
ncbi:hypothetical protein KR018_003993, partial [Drosophila ironensis]